MLKNKYIILPTLFLAWTIIFAHNIVPHHHHPDETLAENHCHHESHNEHKHHTKNLLIPEYDCCDQETQEHACHFHVEILTQFSIDIIFISNDSNSLFSDLNCVETTHANYIKEFVSDKIPETNYLRGPPTIS